MRTIYSNDVPKKVNIADMRALKANNQQMSRSVICF